MRWWMRGVVVLGVVVATVANASADSKDCKAQITAGQAAASDEDYEEARKILHSAYSSCGDPVVLVHIAKTYQDEGKPGYALEYAKRFLNEVDESHPLHAAITRAAEDLQRQTESAPTKNATQTETPGVGENIQGARQNALDERAGDIDYADEPPPGRTGVFLELGGAGVFVTANVERYLTPSLTVRIGAGSYRETSLANADDSVVVYTAPVTVSYLIGNPRHSFEVGLGATAVYFADPASSTLAGDVEADGFVAAATAHLGYRYAGAPRGFLFRAGYTPLVFIAGGETAFAHHAGLSFGARL